MHLRELNDKEINKKCDREINKKYDSNNDKEIDDKIFGDIQDTGLQNLNGGDANNKNKSVYG